MVSGRLKKASDLAGGIAGLIIRAFLQFALATFLLFLLFGGGRTAPSEEHGLFGEMQQVREKVSVGGVAANYGRWLLGVVTSLDLGHSDRQNRTVREIILAGLPLTLGVSLGAMLVGAGIAIPLAWRGALYPESRGIRLASHTLISVSVLPVFFVAAIMRTPWIRYCDIPTFGTGLLACFGYYGIPVVILGVFDGTLGDQVKQIRETFILILREPFIVAARARGASVRRHVFRASAVSVLAIFSSRFTFALGGALIVEYVFLRDGVSLIALDALLYRDRTVILAVGVIFSVLGIGSELLHRIVLFIADPRARSGGGKSPA
ncbi:MAG: ABC transporter permease [Ignavibacteriae bacterium]|nr:ABC transporter permease [Ignavibacteriota bacterium]